MSPRLIHSLLWPALAVWIAFLAWTGRDITFLADDHEFLAIADGMQSPWQAFERGHTSPKPLHHLIFWWGAHCTGPDANWMRVPALLAEALALGFVFRIARQAGASTGGAALATLLYATFATTRSMLWPVAISGFARVSFALAALSFWIDAWEKRHSVVATALAVLATLLAMAAHQSGALTPGFFVLWALLVGGGTLGPALLRGLRALFHPGVLGAIAVVLTYVVWASGTADQYRGFREIGAIAANTLRAVVALAPDELRIAAVAAARGKADGTVRFVGWFVIAACGILWGWRLQRGSGVWRFAILAGFCDIALAVVTAGWSQRYCYLAAALFAIAFGVSWSQATGPALRTLLTGLAIVLGFAWARESLRVAAEQRDASAVATLILERIEGTARTLAPDAQLVVVDAPDVWGLEQDQPLFNWGLEPALRRRGVTQPLRQVRTTAARTSTAASVVPEREVADLRANATGNVFEFVARDRRVVTWREGKPVPERPR